ncbi:Protein MNN4 [Daldinia childiae]|uniref:Protein MNN4 n=1 Tax=Daldinia childiae TaxID=326645 RepID=UPI001444ACEE|nr:Protein MNN4 [Daldinia childiae]KAF3070414.1 Protein MNN4 [Daldinia childiae]
MRFTLPILLFSLTASSLPEPPSSSHHKSNTAHKKSSSKPKPNSQHQPKYFHEAGGTLELGHYDARFFRGVVPYAEHGPALQRLIRSWLATTHELGVDTWLAHGTLLGWWWNGRVMPWDYDLDVQMPTATLSYLGRHFNRTLHDYRFIVDGGGSGGEKIIASGNIDIDTSNKDENGDRNRDSGINDQDIVHINKTYLLDVNPHHTDLARGNGANIIDARWIDTGTGLRRHHGAGGAGRGGGPGRLELQERAPFEGVPARVPYAFDKILTDEYGAKSLVNTEWAGHRWVPELKEWVKNPEPRPGDKEKVAKQQQDGKAVVVVVEKTVVKGAQ